MRISREIYSTSLGEFSSLDRYWSEEPRVISIPFAKTSHFFEVLSVHFPGLALTSPRVVMVIYLGGDVNTRDQKRLNKVVSDRRFNGGIL